MTFSTIERQVIHPVCGVPQLQHDQLNIIAQHIADIKQYINTQRLLSKNDDVIPVIQKLTRRILKKQRIGLIGNLLNIHSWTSMNNRIHSPPVNCHPTLMSLTCYRHICSKNMNNVVKQEVCAMEQRTGEDALPSLKYLPIP